MPPSLSHLHKNVSTHIWQAYPAQHTVEQIPVVDPILDIAIVLQDLRKQFAQEVVIGRLFEAKLADVVQVDAKLLCKHPSAPAHITHQSSIIYTWEAFAQFLYGCSLFLLADLFILLLVRRRLETLPGKASS